MSKPLNRLLSLAKQRINAIQRASLREVGLTEPQAAIMDAVNSSDPADIVTQTMLVGLTGIDNSTLSDIIARLQAKGFVTSTRPDENRRATEIILTLAGRNALKKVAKIVARAEREVLGLLPESQRDAFVSALEIIERAP